MGKFYSFCRATNTISSGCSADKIAQNRKNDRFYLENLLALPKQNQYDKCMTNTYYFGCAARSEGGVSHFDVNTKKQVEFKKFNLLGGCGGRI